MRRRKEGGTGGGEPEKEPYQELLLSLLACLAACLVACLGAHAIIIFINGAGARKEVAFNAVYVPTSPPSLPPCPSLSYIKCILIMGFTYSFLLHPRAKATPPSPSPAPIAGCLANSVFMLPFLLTDAAKKTTKCGKAATKSTNENIVNYNTNPPSPHPLPFTLPSLS